MSTITLHGENINTSGVLPQPGDHLKDFRLTAADMSDKSLEDFKGKNIILNIFPSIDTGVCATSVRHFNKVANELTNTQVLCISKDLPFAQGRFCGAEGLDQVINLSSLRSDSFENEYGLRIIDGPLEGLLSRAVIIADKEGVVLYSEQVPEIAQEPNYESALAVLKKS